MKNVDMALNGLPLRPSRPLRGDFTSVVITELKVRPEPRRKGSGLFHWIRTKIGILSLGLLLVAGTAAAAVTTFKIAPPAPKQTPVPNVNQTITRRLPNGNRLIGYNLQNCHFFSGPTYVDTHSNEDVLYEVKQSSTLTNQQLEASLEGVCESDVNMDNMGAIMQKFEDEGVNPYDEFGTLNMRVEGITPTSITVRIDPAYTVVPIAEQDKLGLTYTQFYQGLKVYNENTPIAYSDIKVGDTVQILMGHTPGYTYTEGVAQEATPSEDIVYAIMKVPPLAADPTTFFLSNGQNIQRVTPCSIDPSGYCPTDALPPGDN